MWLALKALRFWRRGDPVLTAGELAGFVETRSKFVAQTTLYGYVRTRAGTRYASLIEDDVFAGSVNMAKWEIYLACLADLAVYAAARVGQGTGADDGELRALAVGLLDAALEGEETPAERPQGFDDIRQAFGARARSLTWDDAGTGESPFRGSLAALVRWAPVADELKINDVEIVRNSMRFKWKKVREQLDSSIDVDAVITDWRSTDPPISTRLAAEIPPPAVP